LGEFSVQVSKLGQWVPHRLSAANKAKRVQIATELLNRYDLGTLQLDSIVTGDEKWVLYVNVVRRRSWVPEGGTPTPTAKPGLHPKKCLLSFFWDTEGKVFFENLFFLGVVHWEIVPDGRTINAEFYCEQLDRVEAALQEKRSHNQDVKFLHDNATPHTAKVTKTKLNQLRWEVLHHPPYSPDLAPTDFKAFRSLQNWLNGKEFASEAAVKASIQQWIDSKPPGFWVKGIAALPDRWSKVIEYEGEYFPDD
jgi:[histone H3]-lysine36 N-dimethyltransferase SETMAR